MRLSLQGCLLEDSNSNINLSLSYCSFVGNIAFLDSQYYFKPRNPSNIFYNMLFMIMKFWWVPLNYASLVLFDRTYFQNSKTHGNFNQSFYFGHRIFKNQDCLYQDIKIGHGLQL